MATHMKRRRNMRLIWYHFHSTQVGWYIVNIPTRSLLVPAHIPENDHIVLPAFFSSIGLHVSVLQRPVGKAECPWSNSTCRCSSCHCSHTQVDLRSTTHKVISAIKQAKQAKAANKSNERRQGYQDNARTSWRFCRMSSSRVRGARGARAKAGRASGAGAARERGATRARTTAAKRMIVIQT